MKVGLFVPSVLKDWVVSVEIVGFMNYLFELGPHLIYMEKAIVVLQL